MSWWIRGVRNWRDGVEIRGMSCHIRPVLYPRDSRAATPHPPPVGLAQVAAFIYSFPPPNGITVYDVPRPSFATPNKATQ